MQDRLLKGVHVNRSILFVFLSLFLLSFLPTPSQALQDPASQNHQIAATALDPAKLIFREVESGFTEPIFITNAGDGSNRLFVAEQTGFIRIIKNGSLLATPFLDIHDIVKTTSSEQGLVALAFHPNYENNGEFFVAYTAPRNGDTNGSNLVLEKFLVSSGNSDRADVSSGVILLTIPHPTFTNHNGGTLAFGKDGYLYWSTGDGGSGGDPNNNAQNLNSLLGKILRLDVNSGSSYGIPASNPFFSSVDPNIRKEIWAYGLRNPWRLSFDRLTGDLYIGDVGQSKREEIDFQASNSAGGENYGWRVMEGTLCFNPASNCDRSGKILPVTEYDHTLGCAVTGGYVYRGTSFPSLAGQYFYGDYCSGRFFALSHTGSGWQTAELLDTSYLISTFGEDEQGELYLADYATGKIYNIGYQQAAATVLIASTNMGSTVIPTGTSVRKSFAGVNNGPVQVIGQNGTKIVASERVAYSPDNGATWTSYSELMGLPANQLSTSYVFPFYNNADLNTQLRFANAGTTSITVTVTIGGIDRGTYNLGPNQSTRVSYNGLNAGPVEVTSSGGVPIIASERVAYFDGSAWTSFSEMMGLPSKKLTMSYTFPWYNNADLNTQLRFGNVGSANTTVTVTIGGVIQNTYQLAPNTSQRVSYPGLNAGPVRVTSSGGVPIIASERVAYFDGSAWTDFSELMGLPASSLSTSYSFPIYNNVDLNTQLRFGNIGTTSTTVTVTIGGVVKGSYSLAPNASQRVSYSGLNGGPVLIQSSGGVPIIASERVAYFNGSAWTSFSEWMGLPKEQLDPTYWLPWYNNVDVNTQLRFGSP